MTDKERKARREKVTFIRTTGIFYVWYWYYGTFPTVADLKQVCNSTEFFTDEVIDAFVEGELEFKTYREIEKNINLIPARYRVSEKILNNIVSNFFCQL